METKICKKCNIEKDVCEFYTDKKSKDGKRSSCKECMYLYNIQYKKNNKDKMYFISRNYFLKNKEKSYENYRNYSNKNKEKHIKRVKDWRKNNQERIKEYTKLYKEKNKEKLLLKKREYEKNKLKFDSLHKLKKTLRNNVTRGIKKKKFTTTDIIGCDYVFFKFYFESLFTEGMCWEKLGKEIHLDHIIPLSTAKIEEELYKLSHYTNLQPLWAKDNLSKGSKNLFQDNSN
jgi:hypothetical protein